MRTSGDKTEKECRALLSKIFDDCEKVLGPLTADNVIYIPGLVIFDIFSHNHEVIGPDDKIYDLGSFRGSADFIAQFINNSFPTGKQYIRHDFYMGTSNLSDHKQLYPFYYYVFQKLKEYGCNWKYTFPKLYFLDLLHDQSNEDKDYAQYDPYKSTLEEFRKNGVKELKQEFDKIHEDAWEEAKIKPISNKIKAYRDAFGDLPEGHPQKGIK